MKKTLLVTVIAIVLVLSIAGTCFALYKTTPSNKTVNISATEGEACNLAIGTSASLDFSGISPAEGHTSKTVDVTLSISNAALADGVHGIFKVAKAGDLAAYIDVTVNEIPSVGGTLGSAANDATTAQGLDIALSATPKYYRITMALSAAAIADFSLAAEKTGTLTVTWAVNNESVFTFDPTAYYVVGTINGVTSWTPNESSVKMSSTGVQNGDLATVTHTFAVGDTFKVVSGEPLVWHDFWSGATENFSNSGGQITINTAGTYKIDVNHEGHPYISYIE
ncbi:MAG: hypothetical protein K5753_01490 [Clostridia bacterium]|nr:hypothetical protein [Clostridia bacterium]